MASLKQSLSAFCIANGIKMNTDLGQHFLIDESVLESIVQAADIAEKDTVVEIGPGVGVLTKELLAHSAEVIAIELDARFIPLIKKYTDNSNKLTLINQNALSVPFPETPYKIVANIPYHITSPLLRHAFLEGSALPLSLTLLMQKEVAEKICDQKNRSMLTIIVGLFGTPHIVRHVPPDAFLPPPKVDSSVLHIDCFTEPKADAATIETVFMLTKHAFSQKRKMLRNTMATLPGGMEALDATNIDPSRRPQTVTVDEWILCAKHYNGNK